MNDHTNCNGCTSCAMKEPMQFNEKPRDGRKQTEFQWVEFGPDLSSIADNAPVVFAFGAGLNSTAVAVEWVLRGYTPPHRILFADTGGERPETYEHIEMFSAWLVSQGMPAIEITKKGGRDETLEQYAIRTKHLPSMAYGRKSCSHKFKIEPQERDINRWPVARAAWKRGEKVVKVIGYGYEEQRRLSLAKIEDNKYLYRFPLNEWQLDRDGCVAIIKRAGLPVPPKSSCFFCPSMRKSEIVALSGQRPDLIERAIHIEDVARENGNLETVQGLGRRFAWRDFLAGIDVPEEAEAAACMWCADGDAEDPTDGYSLPIFQQAPA